MCTTCDIAYYKAIKDGLREIYHGHGSRGMTQDEEQELYYLLAKVDAVLLHLDLQQKEKINTDNAAIDLGCELTELGHNQRDLYDIGANKDTGLYRRTGRIETQPLPPCQDQE